MGKAAQLNGSQDTRLSATDRILHRKHLINIILACLAIGLEIYYSICAGSCSYLRGTLLGIDLQYVGMAYMASIILLSLFRKDMLLIVLISAGVGIELYLIGFQVWYDTYCPYCLAFAAIVFALLILNFRRDRKVLSAISMAFAVILFALFFKGSLAPSYSYTLQISFAERAAGTSSGAPVSRQYTERS
ncbi:MAG: hypothetical protein PHC90_07810 [Syntrophorhabdaceae bacterium]|nr:hypothetical protein [Syntrophorhabdaceae bacterium]